MDSEITGLGYVRDIETKATRPLTIRERLMNERKHYERRIKELGEALELLDRNPDFEKLQDLLAR